MTGHGPSERCSSAIIRDTRIQLGYDQLVFVSLVGTYLLALIILLLQFLIYLKLETILSDDWLNAMNEAGRLARVRAELVVIRDD